MPSVSLIFFVLKLMHLSSNYPIQLSVLFGRNVHTAMRYCGDYSFKQILVYLVMFLPLAKSFNVDLHYCQTNTLKRR